MGNTRDGISTTIATDGSLLIVERRYGCTRVVSLTSSQRGSLLVKLELDATRRKVDYSSAAKREATSS